MEDGRPDLVELNAHMRLLHSEMKEERSCRRRMEQGLRGLRQQLKAQDIAAAPQARKAQSAAERRAAAAAASAAAPRAADHVQAWAVDSRLQRLGHASSISPAHVSPQRRAHPAPPDHTGVRKYFANRGKRATIIRPPRAVGGLAAMMRADPAAVDVSNILCRLDHFLRVRSMRPIDLFREMGKHPTLQAMEAGSVHRIPLKYNWALTEGDRQQPSMFTAAEFRKLLNTRLCLRLSPHECAVVVHDIDTDKNGMIDCGELEEALALSRVKAGQHRREQNNDWASKTAALVKGGATGLLYQNMQRTRVLPGARARTPVPEWGVNVDGRPAWGAAQ
jgi:hypothetical protein